VELPLKPNWLETTPAEVPAKHVDRSWARHRRVLGYAQSPVVAIRLVEFRRIAIPILNRFGAFLRGTTSRVLHNRAQQFLERLPDWDQRLAIWPVSPRPSSL